MKVLIITNNIELTSGWGRYSRGVIDELKHRGVEICIASEVANINYETKKIHNSSSAINLLRNIFVIRRLSKGYDIVHALDGWPYGVYGYFATFGSKKKLFINGVGTYSVAPLYLRLKGFFLRLAYRRAKRIFTISEYVKQRILDKVKLKNIETVNLGLTNLPSPSLSEIEKIKEQYGIISHYPILLTVGGIKERKGQLETLQAVNLLKEKYPDILYVMIGSSVDSLYVDKIKKYAKENNLEGKYLILSSIEDDLSLACCYVLCDVFLLNSNNGSNHFEGFGQVILEANQFGKPAIGSRDCGIKDVIKDGVNGYLNNQKDPKDISEKIMKVFEGKKLDENAIINHAKSFTWEKAVGEYINEYKK